MTRFFAGTGGRIMSIVTNVVFVVWMLVAFPGVLGNERMAVGWKFLSICFMGLFAVLLIWATVIEVVKLVQLRA